jgi:hypothetical protein
VLEIFERSFNRFGSFNFPYDIVSFLLGNVNTVGNSVIGENFEYLNS